MNICKRIICPCFRRVASTGLETSISNCRDFLAQIMAFLASGRKVSTGFPFVFLVMSVSVLNPVVAARTEVQLSEGWRFLRADATNAHLPGFDDSTWTEVSVPHTWNNLDGQNGGNNYYRGTGWYRKWIWIEQDPALVRSYLRFEAVGQVADVYVNGTHLGQHKGGFTAFAFDVTDHVTPGEWNLVAVRANNRPSATMIPITGDFNLAGGIYRGVKLVNTTVTHIDLLDNAGPGVYIRTTKNPDSTGYSMLVELILRNETDVNTNVAVQVKIYDADGALKGSFAWFEAVAKRSVARIERSYALGMMREWDGINDPYLYEAVIQIRAGYNRALLDRVNVKFGARSYSVSPSEGFILNGRPYRLHGVAMHQDWQDLGWAIGQEEQEQNLALLEELGATFVRLSHYPHADSMLDLLDCSGIVVWAEIPLVNTAVKSTAFVDHCRQQLTEMIVQNYNHPSIVFWGLHNELRSVPQTPEGGDLLRDLHVLAKTLDVDRITTVAALSGTPMDSALVHNSEVCAYNHYYGWYVSGMDNFGAKCDLFHQVYPNRSLGISEYGAGGSIYHHAENPTKVGAYARWHPEEYMALVHERHWPQIAARPYLWCSTVWNMFDFAVDGRNEGDTPGRNDKGLVTFDRSVRKDPFFYYKAQWNPQPMVYLCSRRFSSRSSGPIEIKAYSNCSSVKLFQNGVSRGPGTAENRVFRWPQVELQPGENVFTVITTSAGGLTIADQMTIFGYESMELSPILVHVQQDSQGTRIGFPTTLDKKYRVQRAPDPNGVWTTLVPEALGTGGDLVLIDPSATSQPIPVYRVQLLN
jgi:beta-galactosidase